MGHFRKQQITIFPTNTCNMNCLYCVANSSLRRINHSSINIDFAKNGIDDYFYDNKKHQIRFYSNGEPTCNMHIIRECINHGKKIINNRKKSNIETKDLVSEIQTNCYFTSDTAEWIGENIDYVWASIDGWPEIQTKYRPVIHDPAATYKILSNFNRIRAIKERHSHDSFIGIRTTIVQETVDKQIELLKYFRDIGASTVCSEPCFAPVDTYHKKNSITLVDLKKYIYNFVEAWHKAQEFGVEYINSFMVNFDENVEYACRSCLPTPHLTVDGYVSSCDLGFHGQSSLPDLIYGRYNVGTKKIEYFDKAISRLQTRKCCNIPECLRCKIKNACGGGCLGRAYHETNNFYGVIKEYCWATKYLYKHLDVAKIKIKHLHP